MEEFLQKLEADQERLRRHLRGQAVRFKNIGEALARARRNQNRIFVFGEDGLEEIARIIAEEYLHSWPVIPISLRHPELNELEGLASGSEIVGSAEASAEVRDLVRRFRAGDLILVFVHEGSATDLISVLQLAQRRELLTLVIGGIDARESLRGVSDVFLPLPTRGIKTICEASFTCARLIARCARMNDQSETEEGRLVRLSCPECHETVFVEEQLAGRKGNCPYCRKLVRLPRPRSRRSARRAGMLEIPEPQESEGGDRRRKSRRGTRVIEMPPEPDEGPPEKIRAQRAREDRDRVDKVAEKAKGEPSGEARRDRPSTVKLRRRKTGSTASAEEPLEPRGSAAEELRGARSSKSAEASRSAQQSAATEWGQGSRERAREAGDREAESPRRRSERRSKTASGSSRQSAVIEPVEPPEVPKTPAAPASSAPELQSVEIPAAGWLKDEESQQEPIGIGSSYKSSGILGGLELDSSELMPRYILDGMDPESKPAREVEPSDAGEGNTRRFVSARFEVQQCELRFSMGAFPDEAVPSHKLLTLSQKGCAFRMDGDDVAAATLTPGDELWLRIEVPAFLEPVLARAAIAGFESRDDEAGLRVELRFGDLDAEQRRKIRIAAESLATGRA